MSNENVDVDDDYDESLERALADLEMVMAAYPDEITPISSSSSSNMSNISNNNHTAAAAKTCSCSSFPLQFRLHLSSSCYFDLSMRSGYPTSCNIEITSFRCDIAENKQRMDAAANAIRSTAMMCLQQQDDDDDDNGGGVEGGLACCAAAMEAWNNHAVSIAVTTTCTTNTKETTTSHDQYLSIDNDEQEGDEEEDDNGNTQQQQQEHYESFQTSNMTNNNKQQQQQQQQFTWITGKPLLDRKSTFLAHACHVSSEADVQRALQQLLESHSKYRRATHNMYAYRLLERLPPKDGQECNNSSSSNNSKSQSQNNTVVVVLKHDNDDDGEDGAGSRLAHLLEMRQESNMLVLVSRWYGGIQLGPKRFVHINNVARDVLVQAAAASAEDATASSSS